MNTVHDCDVGGVPHHAGLPPGPHMAVYVVETPPLGGRVVRFFVLGEELAGIVKQGVDGG